MAACKSGCKDWIWACWNAWEVNAYLLEQLRGRISCQDGSRHVWAHSVELLDLSLPRLQQALPSFVHPLASRPLALQVKGEAGLLSRSPENNREECGKWPCDPAEAAQGPRCDEQKGLRIAHLKGASATALVVMVMWSENSFQVDKKRTETPVWSWRWTTAWWDFARGSVKIVKRMPNFLLENKTPYKYHDLKNNIGRFSH